MTRWALSEALINTFISEVNSSETNEYDNIGFSDEEIFNEFDKYLTEAVLGSTPGDNERKRLLYAVLALERPNQQRVDQPQPQHGGARLSRRV